MSAKKMTGLQPAAKFNKIKYLSGIIKTEFVRMKGYTEFYAFQHQKVRKVLFTTSEDRILFH